MDASTQTDDGDRLDLGDGTEGDDENKEDDDDSDEVFTNTLKECGICLEAFSSENSIQVPSCGHPICRVCVDRIFDNQWNQRCPFCRSICHKTDFVKLNQTSIQSVTFAERDTLQKKTRKVKLKCDQTLRETQAMLRLERERCQFLSLPAYCTRSQRQKKCGEYLAFINSKTIETKMIKSIIDLRTVSRQLESLMYKIINPTHVDLYDSSQILAKAMVKVLESKQRACSSCRPNVR